MSLQSKIVFLFFVLSLNTIYEAKEEAKEEATEQTISQEDDRYTDPPRRFEYLKGDREPEDKNYNTPDAMYRDAMQYILRLFWSEKCHIGEIKFQFQEMNTTLEKQIADKFSRANYLMSQCADEVLDTLRENVTSSERIEPCDRKIIDEIGQIFKEARQFFNKEIKSEGNVTEPMSIVRKEIQLAEEQLYEGYGIVKEMIKNSSTLVWPKT